jgi:hypothetical protein
MNGLHVSILPFITILGGNREFRFIIEKRGLRPVAAALLQRRCRSPWLRANAGESVQYEVNNGLTYRPGNLFSCRAVFLI